MTSGPIALVGSGEFTPATADVDLLLLEGRAQRVVFLPTAAALEGAAIVDYWVDLGRKHYARLRLDAIPLLVLNREDADRDDLAATLATAGLIYLSGGDPTYVAATLTGSAVGNAIHGAWISGAAIAGCSAGALALMEDVPDIRDRGANPTAGLGLVRNMLVMPHFDQLENWSPGAIRWALEMLPAGVQLIGIEEETAIVGGPVEWHVMGRRRAWRLLKSGDRVGYQPGDMLRTDSTAV